MFWSVNAQDEYSSWNDFKEEVSDFKNAYFNLIDFQSDCSQMIMNTPDLICSFYPNPATNSIFLEYHSKENQSVLVNIYSINGALVQQDKLSLLPNQEALELTIDNLMNGLYFVEIVQERNGGSFRVFTQKLMKID